MRVDVERLHAIVHGSVQGVGFRHWAERRARMLGLTGWVSNRADGTVEAVAEGPSAALGEFLGLLRQGPAYADVHSVDTDFSPATGEFADFGVRF